MQNFSIKITDLPSLYQEPKITSTIKENPFKSNTEIEGKEIVLAPDLSAIYKAVGDRHSKGGMDVYLPPESFVFSDFKDLAISPEEHDQFELKKGSKKLQDNTPAKVIQRNIDTKHYNKMTSILNDVKKTEFEKRTAMLMLNKYEDTLGKVAYIQESKKNFPDGLPEFAKDTAPIFDTELKNEIMENKQYMKWGGKTNPFLPKAQDGLYATPFGKDYVNNLIPSTKQQPLGLPFQNKNVVHKTSQNNIPPTEGLFNPYWNYLANEKPDDFVFGYNMDQNPNLQLSSPQHKIQGSQYTNNFDLNEFKNRHAWYIKNHPNFNPQNENDVKDFQNTYNTEAEHRGYQPYFIKGNSFRDIDGKLGEYTKNALGFREQEPIPNKTTPFQDNPPEFPDTQFTPKNPLNQRYGWTNDMKRTTALDAWNAASIQKGQVYRPQIKSSLVELEKLNPQSALNNVNNAATRSSQNLKALNPFLATGQNAGIYGQSLDNLNQIQGQYDNQNVQIGNQQNSQNNQIQNNDARTNIGFDNQFFKENELNKAHFANAKQFAWNKVNEDVNSNNRQIDQIRYFNGALSPNSPFYLSLGNNGRYNPIDNPNRNIFGATNPYAKQDYLEAEQEKQAQRMIKAGVSAEKAYQIATKFVGVKALGANLPQQNGYPQQQVPQKKGGKIKNNPFK